MQRIYSVGHILRSRLSARALRGLAAVAVCCLALPLPAQVPAVAYRPFRHYGERTEQFAREEPIDSSDIVMLGNSLTENGGDWSRLLGAAGVVNRGISGDDATGMAHRLVQILPGRPRAVFLMAGVNDLSHGLAPAAVAAGVERVVELIRRGSPATRLFVQSLLPIDEGAGRWPRLAGRSAAIAEVNRLLAGYCRANGIVFIDLYPKFVRRGTRALRRELSRDGLHLTPQGYKLWAFELRRHVRSLGAGLPGGAAGASAIYK